MAIQLLSVPSFEHQKEIDTIQDIISQHFDGVIMLPSCWHDDLYQLLQNAGIPVVLLDQIPASMRHFPVDCVISDNYKGGALLAEHLLEKATQRSGSWNSIWTPTPSSSGSRALWMYIRKMALTF